MAKNLVIVESPAKAKTIEKFLGKEYKVESSFGHIADLPSKELGVDVDNNFAPKYIVDKDKKALVKKLKDLADKADTIWLASDEDREGEAISWHLAEELKLDKNKTKRIVFNSITKSAIQKAIENPREINYDLVNAQQARRVLDRLVGYELSPVLWKKIKPGLSAGRVQSVAVRLIVEREREIEAFNPEAAFRVSAEFKTNDGSIFTAKLNKTYASQKEAEAFLKENIGANFSVANLDKKPAKKSPAAPFTTSTLQQEASRKLYFSVSRTMQVAQRLYEAGLITYMRTDSVNLSQDAIDAAQDAIISNYGKEYSKVRNFTGKSKGAQEAHEAIRPTEMTNQSPSLERDQSKLYELIWKRTLASQMSDAELERTNVKIKANTHKEEFTANGEVIKFDGFLKVYLESRDEEDINEEQEGMLPAMKEGEKLLNNYITATERFSRAPYRFTEASLVKKLEELGIGRPSTYAPTISTIQNRGYVDKGTIEGTERNYVQLLLKSDKLTTKDLKENVGSDKGKLVPTDIGIIVTDFLVGHFETILDYHFTAKVEEDFDGIASGDEDWQKVLKDFYGDFHPKVLDVEENADRASGERVLGTDPKTGRQVSVRLGRFGPMVQVGTVDDEEKPLFASLLPDQSLNTISYEEAMDLFKLPRKLGVYEGEDVEANVGRFGPYIRFGKKFVSLGKDENAMEIDMDRAVELIKEKEKADAPIAVYENKEVTKGVGRFGPFIKWDGMFINVSKKYDLDSLSKQDIADIIEAKKQKEIERLVQEWPEAGIRIEKARWGRHTIIKGKVKVEVSKDVDATKISLKDAQELIEKKTPKKKTKTKPKAKK
ncbi:MULTISPECIES: type I DNA topoisomerase [unclassified Arenibacter]|uniref:type I DNA topoisomerase n=1 Tax=unclassified Arenibacter TaxID=2615047 RepID=UPI000E3514FA|nr:MULTISPECIES: type I DNA topoisomerase [unclassified Arenibacter]MCM4163706.1 type I DNA topoisomerase [Arenibacter sp. A80]RFT56431.1 type I DNA topoisomerase [Arenibacter sp. P308M17]